jgi:hypothetical protein
MHPLTKLLDDEPLDPKVVDKIIRQYLQERADAFIQHCHLVGDEAKLKLISKNTIFNILGLSPSEQKEEKGWCGCGQPQTSGIVHRLNNPCYIKEPSQPRPEFIDKYSNGWIEEQRSAGKDVHVFYKINQLISCVEELRNQK